MSAGIQPTMQDVSFAVGSSCLNIKKAFDTIKSLKGYIDPIGSAGLQTLGFSAGDADVIVSAITELDALRQVFEGTFIVTAGANPGEGVAQAGNGRGNFTAFAKLLWGFGF